MLAHSVTWAHQLHVGQVSIDRVCYKHCPGVLYGHCPPVAIPRPAKSSSVCVEKVGDGPGWSGHPITRISCAQRSSCNRSQCSYISTLSPDLLDLILELCWPSSSPGDELKSYLLPLDMMVCPWETTSQAAAGLMDMTTHLHHHCWSSSHRMPKAGELDVPRSAHSPLQVTSTKE